MDNTNLFSGKAEVYAKARPGYPNAAISYLLSQLPENPMVADIGAGTGKFSVLLAQRGVSLFAVEPNDDMRNALIKTLSPYQNAVALGGTAENTTIAEHSVDAAVCAQAFHWFEPTGFKKECLRILKPHGKVFVVYNAPGGDEPILHELNWWDELHPPTHSYKARIETISAFFARKEQYAEFANPISFSGDAFLAFMLSHSSSPSVSDEYYESYCDAVRKGFMRISREGIYTMNRLTCIYWNELDGL
ncbi:MAG: class I SAM-dependent methyltransferase [Clostridiales bacterium]|jgi:SAM-dependent methyltransferase|nr:class I SAM-dependent methyltransferase [Clostridiales bacterium]